MPKLYIANAKHQVEEFTYWLPEGRRPMQQSIPIGGQILVGGKDLPAPAINDILEAKAPYGLLELNAALRAHPFYGLAYQVDRPIQMEKLVLLIDRYNGVLNDIGKQLRSEAAIATNQFLNDRLFEAASAQGVQPPRVESYEMHVEEMKRGPGAADTPEVNERMRVELRGEAAQQEAARTARRRRTK